MSINTRTYKMTQDLMRLEILKEIFAEWQQTSNYNINVSNEVHFYGQITSKNVNEEMVDMGGKNLTR